MTSQITRYSTEMMLHAKPNHPDSLKGPYGTFFRRDSKFGRIQAIKELVERRIKLLTKALNAVVLPTYRTPRRVIMTAETTVLMTGI